MYILTKQINKSQKVCLFTQKSVSISVVNVVGLPRFKVHFYTSALAANHPTGYTLRVGQSESFKLVLVFKTELANIRSTPNLRVAPYQWFLLRVNASSHFDTSIPCGALWASMSIFGSRTRAHLLRDSSPLLIVHISSISSRMPGLVLRYWLSVTSRTATPPPARSIV